ncbi:MAG: hypothetical protein FRX48_03007 [Lasallia pustulata]|uniref:Uncharacterized protein n=1 Tax=Lasallia pustulata TaxID=136370 RepID=A0A5M8PX58_9LECA|nr:MAG: hypothetical protein FRX48_03007 [Lasallia pustulata]
MDGPIKPESSVPWSVRRLLPWYPRDYKQTSFDRRFRRLRVCLIDHMVSECILRYDYAHLKGDGRPNVLPGKYGKFELQDFFTGKVPGLQSAYENHRTAVMPCRLCCRPHQQLRPWPPHHAAAKGDPVTVAPAPWEAGPDVGSQHGRSQSQHGPLFEQTSCRSHPSQPSRDQHDRSRAASWGENADSCGGGNQRIMVNSRGMTWRDE